LAFGIILLFLSVSVASSIKANTPQTSSDDDLVVMVQTDKINYRIGEPVEISVYVENHGDTTITLVFSTTQTSDYAISNYYCNIYWWSEGLFFIPMMCYVTLPSGGKKLLLHDTWGQTHSNGNQVDPGTYQIIGWMVQSVYYPPVYSVPVYINVGTEINIGIHGGKGVNVSVSNIGNLNATDVEGHVLITGGILGFIQKIKHFDVENLAVNESVFVTLRPFGFGRVSIEISAITPNAKAVYLKTQWFVIMYFVYPIPSSNEIMEVSQ
jgi:hypothetical protein